ncbi:MAG: molybdopterin-guanine dinucleotide biosynthesis protein B [Methanobacteriaceae archaeon]
MRIVGITGLKNTGKTTLVVKIIKELKKRGFGVATIKKTHSTFDTKGRDTAKHSEGGAEIVVGSGIETFFKVDKEIELEEILKEIKEMKSIKGVNDPDFVILEGFKEAPYIKIATAQYEDKYENENTIVETVDVRELSDTDISEIADLIEDRSFGILPMLNCKKCGFDNCNEFRLGKIEGLVAKDVQCATDVDTAILKVDGVAIPMNPFVKELVKNVTAGIVETLRTKEFGAEDFKRIELIVEKED